MSKQTRAHMHEAVEQMIELDPPSEEDGPAILRSWVLVATIRYADGANQMYKLTGDAVGESLAQWEEDGILHYALNAYQPMDAEDA